MAVASVTWEKNKAQELASGGGLGGYTVYNLTVDGDHTFFVGTTGGGTWVHNASCASELKAYQHAFGRGHASDFGITGNWNKATAAALEDAVQGHMADPDTLIIPGTYRGMENVTHYYNQVTRLWSAVDEAGNFKAGWRLSTDQLEYLENLGNVQ
jgi:hypothetical protein